MFFRTNAMDPTFAKHLDDLTRLVRWAQHAALLCGVCAPVLTRAPAVRAFGASSAAGARVLPAHRRIVALSRHRATGLFGVSGFGFRVSGFRVSGLRYEVSDNPDTERPVCRGRGCRCHTCTCVHIIHACMHTYIHILRYVHSYVHSYVHTHVRTHIHTYKYTYITRVCVSSRSTRKQCRRGREGVSAGGAVVVCVMARAHTHTHSAPFARRSKKSLLRFRACSKRLSSSQVCMRARTHARTHECTLARMHARKHARRESVCERD